MYCLCNAFAWYTSNLIASVYTQALRRVYNAFPVFWLAVFSSYGKV